MSSRAGHKEAARRKREEAEAAAELAASRRKRLQLAFGGLGVVVVIGGIVAAVVLGGGGGEEARPKASLPAVETTDLQAAAKLAGATFTTYAYDYGTGNHVTTPVKYPQNPPTNGPHHPEWASDANYAGTTTPPTERLVHALEHGRIEIQYRPGLPQAQIDRLVALYDEDPYHVLLFENKTDMPADVAVTAWSHGMLMKSATPAMFDAIRAFRDQYRDTAPEKVA
ncbi:MAG: DUF3105 domain-containing protein [Solirubrobacteraceae bacterium]|nr:DUF3105 domain-containing protein [Solirubrobacteraceae bacterium]